MRLKGSLTARLAALFAMMASGLLIVMGVVIDRAISVHFDELDLHDLSAKIATIEMLLSSINTPEALDTLPRQVNDVLAGHQGVAIRLSIPQQDWQYELHNDRFDRVRHTLMASSGHLTKWSDANGATLIGKAVTFQVNLPETETETETVNVLVGLDISHHLHFLRNMRLQLGLGIFAATLLAGLLGWLVAQKGLAPMRQVAATARQLSAKSLTERLSVEDAPAEMQDLVEAFNGMLERLENSFTRLNEFSADIAHELRSPVSNLMTETQVALSRTRTAEEYREALHSNLEEFDRLARMIADMLFLAKADNGMLPKTVSCVKLEVEMAALIDFYEALAEEKNLTLNVSGKGEVRGDSLMLRRALSNLLSNSIRHTPSGETIKVRIHQEGESIRLSISNPGEAIPPEHISRVFERFHRVDPSRLRHSEGSGLGLSITRSIIDAHGAQIMLNSDSNLTTFTIIFPVEQPLK